MSFRLTWTLALRDRGPRDASAKLLGLTLATHMDGKGGSCYPGRELLAKETSLGVRTIERAARRLEADGWLRIARSKGRHSNKYQATLPEPRHSDAVQQRQNDVVQPRQKRQPTASESTPNSVRATPELVSKPVTNSSDDWIAKVMSP